MFWRFLDLQNNEIQKYGGIPDAKACAGGVG